MAKRALWFAIALALGVATPAFPCSVVRLIGPEELVERARLIVRARSEGATDSDGTRDNVLAATSGQVRFRVIEVVKGTFAGSELVFNGRLEGKDDWNDRPPPYDFVRRGGRAGNCYALGYRAGAEYLLFLRQPESKADGAVVWSPYWAALAPTNEQLRGPDDKWLNWVVRQIKRKPRA